MGETTGYFYSPALRFLAPIVFGWDRYKRSLNTVMKAFQESVTKHDDTLDYSNHFG